MTEKQEQWRLLIGAWLDAVGTIISAVAEVRTLAGRNEINNQLVAIGEGLQAVGTMVVGTVTTENPLNFAGNWIDGAGAAASAVGAARQGQEGDTEDAIRLELFGDALQSMGAAISAVADVQEGDFDYAFGNAVQSLGAGLEAIGGLYELNERDQEGQPITTIGAILQALGSNFNAILVTKEFRHQL